MQLKKCDKCKKTIKRAGMSVVNYNWEGKFIAIDLCDGCSVAPFKYIIKHAKLSFLEKKAGIKSGK